MHLQFHENRVRTRVDVFQLEDKSPGQIYASRSSSAESSGPHQAVFPWCFQDPPEPSNNTNTQLTNPTCKTEENLQDKSSLRTLRHVFSCSVRNDGRPRTRCSSMSRYPGVRVAFRNIGKHSGSFTDKQNRDVLDPTRLTRRSPDWRRLRTGFVVTEQQRR